MSEQIEIKNRLVSRGEEVYPYEVWGDWKYSVLEDGTIEIKGYDINAAEVVIPSEINGIKVTSIGEWAFDYCSIKSVEIPSTVTNIGVQAFQGCSLESIKIPESVKTIENEAFDKCDDLKSIEISNSVETIGKKAFNWCTNATSAVTLTWNKASGAKGYDVYRATSKNGKYTKVASVTKTSYKDSKLKAGKTYYYKVCAYKSVEGTKLCGDYSAIVPAGTQTAKPSLKVVAGKKKATLS